MGCSCLLDKYNLQVQVTSTSYKLQVTTYNLQVQLTSTTYKYNLQVQVTSYNLQVTSTSYKLQLTSYKLQLTLHTHPVLPAGFSVLGGGEERVFL